MKAQFNPFTVPFAIVLDSFESESGAIIEFTMESSGKFGVYTRVGPFAYTVEFDSDIEAYGYFATQIEIEEYAAMIKRLLFPKIEFALIAFEF